MVSDVSPAAGSDGGGASAGRGPSERRTVVCAVANQKGGVGKTTTAVNTAAALAESGWHVLLVDLDPQANATTAVGLQLPPRHLSTYDVLVRDTKLGDVLVPAAVTGLEVLPASADLAGAEIELVSMFSRERRLRHALDQAGDRFDLVLLDCPPSLGLLTINALSAADVVLVPVQCEYLALEGLSALLRNTELVRSHINPGLEILGFALTMLDQRTKLSQQVVDEVEAHLGDRVFRTRIPRSVRLAEAPSFGEPITVFDPTSRAALAYHRLAREVVTRLVTEGMLAVPAGQGGRS